MSALEIAAPLPWVSIGQLSPALPPCPCQPAAMVLTRVGSRLRPRVRFSTPEREDQALVPSPDPAPVPAPVPEAVPEEPQGFRRYQTRMGPRAPSLVPQRRSRRARPSKRARTSGPGESSSSRPQSSPATSAVEATFSPQLSPASRIRRPLFVGHPIPGNVGLHSRDFHGEPFYDVPSLMADPRFRDSMRLIEYYSLLPFMTPRQFYYPRVVLQFYHSMTSRGEPSPLELRFTIDDRPGVLRAANISAALGLRYRRPILEVIEIGLTRLSGRWSASSPETPQPSLYYPGGSSRLIFSLSTTCSGRAFSRCSTTYSVGGPS